MLLHKEDGDGEMLSPKGEETRIFIIQEEEDV